MFSLSVLLAVSIFQLTAGQVPPGVKPCNRTDPHLSTCIVNFANAALPVILQNMVVLDVPTLEVKLTPVLDVFLSDRQSFSPNNLKVTNATWNFTQQHVTMDLSATALNWNVAYLATGILLDQDFNEEGRANFTLVSPHFRYEADYTLLPVNGLVYAQITNADSSTFDTNFSFTPLQPETQITARLQTEFVKLAQGLMDNMKDDFRLLFIEVLNTAFNFVLESAPFNDLFLP